MGQTTVTVGALVHTHCYVRDTIWKKNGFPLSLAIFEEVQGQCVVEIVCEFCSLQWSK